jgi:hypothetical protein
MTPDTPKPSPNATETPAKWVSVAEAAAARRCSIRTVKRWIETGEVESRKEGGRRLVLLLDSSAERDTEGPKGTRQRGHKPGGVSLLAPFDAQKEGHSEGTQDARPVSLLALSGAESSEREAELLRDSLASERAQNAFLRSTIEQLQRDGAETRAALREALKLAPKAITAGAAESSDAAPMDGRSDATGSKPTKGAPDAPESSETGLSYGDIADWLEGKTNDADDAK